MSDKQFSRRRFLAASGVLTATALGGCIGNDSGDTPTPTGTPRGNGTPTGNGTGTGTTTPTKDTDFTGAEQQVATFLTKQPVADNFDSSFTDATGTGAVTVDVGAQGNQGNFAFAPPALTISTGTTVTWKWTGKGGQHNVVSTGESDFSLDSGAPVMNGEFEHTFEQTGVALYLCEPHASLGMKGGIVVE